MKLIRIQCDVLIVGSGGAGLRSAIEARQTDEKLKVIIATKGELGKSGVTALSCSDRMAFHATLPYTEPVSEDNWKYHADDIFRIGGCVSDQDLAVILARNSRYAYEYLDTLGVPFAKENGKAVQFVTDGSKYARACYTGPYTANHIEEALVKEIQKSKIDVIDNCMITELILSGDKSRITGAFGVRQKNKNSSELIVFDTKTCILATGGAGEVFEFNVFPEGMTGDGCALAWRSGAELVNLEFIQIGLCSTDTKLACSGSMMRAIPRFINDKGEEFLFKYFSRHIEPNDLYHIVFKKGASWPVSSESDTNIVDVAVFKEIFSGRRIYLDYEQNPKGFVMDEFVKKVDMSRFTEQLNLNAENIKGKPVHRLISINPQSVDWFKKRNIDLLKGDKIEIMPAIQHFQGGVKIRTNGETTIRGLYAAGECAGGQHGANRPGGNALMDCQVFGKITGNSAAVESNKIKNTKVSDSCIRQYIRFFETLDNKKGIEAGKIREKVQELMSRNCSVVRTKQNLEACLKGLDEIENKKICVDKKGLIFTLETINILDVARIITTAIESRKESRGPHLLFDKFGDNKPSNRDDRNWQKYMVLKKMRRKKISVEIKDPVKTATN